jgi:RNA polymerase sigma factor (sigma-70 family)
VNLNRLFGLFRMKTEETKEVALTSTEKTDAELIRSSLEKPEEFQFIFRRHFNSICRYVARRVGVEAGEDIAAQVFVDAFRNRNAYNPAYLSARPWLFGIASNELRRCAREERRRLRAYARTVIAETVEPDLSLDTEDNSELWPGLARALADLRAGDRDVLLLFAWAELSYEDIAVALSIPVGTVRSRLNRARGQIRSRLGEVPKEDPRTSEAIIDSRESAWMSLS